MRHITGDVYGVLTQFGFLNSYVLKLTNGVALIDLGMDAAHLEKIEQGLTANGWSLDDVKHIFITHCHYDHVGALADLQRKVNAPTYAHRLDAPVIRGEQAPVYAQKDELGGLARLTHRLFISNIKPTTPARVDVELNDGDSLDNVYPGMQAIHLPGHSYGQIGLWLANERILIGGDVMIRTPFRLTMPVRSASPDWEQAKESIRKVGKLPVDALCVGHGQPITENAAPQIAKLVQRIG